MSIAFEVSRYFQYIYNELYNIFKGVIRTNKTKHITQFSFGADGMVLKPSVVTSN